MSRPAQILICVFALVTLAAMGCAQVDLAMEFAHPPASAKPHTWWHWMNGNITREGITADLEAMRQIGLGGAQIFNVSEGIPAGPVAFMSPEWRALVAHAVREAHRLGLELCMHNCAGWSSSGGPWVTPEHAMQMVVMSETRVSGPIEFSAVLAQPESRRDFYRDIAVLAFPTPRDGGARVTDIAAKAGYEARYGQDPELLAFADSAVVASGSMVDLSSKLVADGRLTWSVPAGDWTILRIGHTPTGKDNHPAPDSGRGLECDKLSRSALDAHWAGMMAQVIDDLGPLAGQTLNNCLIDSYEVGHQNWTPNFRAEFRARRGYDLLTWLPVLSGRVVDSGEASERFLWDLRRTIGELFAENYYDHFSELCHASGLRASIEPYDGPFECLRVGRGADIPMGEFWVGSGESSSCKLAASVAHIYGKTIVGAESFTADPAQGRWLNHPYALKAVGDLMYSTGINRYIVHRYAHQPWLDRVPGMTMGQWGTHFERTVTWWEQGAAWVQYLTRCQYLLQKGAFVADVCYFAGEATPNGAPHVPSLKALGHDYDACNADVILHHMSVRDGRIVLASGMTYRLLVLPETTFMTPQLIEKLRDLVQQGAMVLGPKPVRSPSLADLGDGDARVQRLADEMWGNASQPGATQHAFGKGYVFTNQSVEQVLANLAIVPDCTFTSEFGKAKVAWIHRRSDAAEIYFVANQRTRNQRVEFAFRVSDMIPEIWHPDTGATEIAPVWSQSGGRTIVPIDFDPAGSAFVVFRKPAHGSRHVIAVRGPEARETTANVEIKSAFYEAVDGSGSADVTAKVRELHESGEVSITANNATFGDPTVNHVKRLRVDYLLDGKAITRLIDENGTLDLFDAPTPSRPPATQIAWSAAAQLELRAFMPGTFEVVRADGTSVTKTVAEPPAPIAITGPWQLRFPPDLGAPPSTTLTALVSWTDHPDPGVRYFSGTAVYTAQVDVSAAMLNAANVVHLDLGEVHEIAQVSLNGTSLGVWWKPPFAADVTSRLKVGANTLEVRVTNLWVNRLIGDEQYADDCEWNGGPIKCWPQWLRDGSPRPAAQRVAFTTWKHYQKGSALLPSGLLGPVRLMVGKRVAID